MKNQMKIKTIINTDVYRMRLITLAWMVFFLTGPSLVYAKTGKVEISASPGPYKVGSTVSITISNNRKNSVSCCVSFNTTMLHTKNDDLPVPLFDILFQRNKEDKWGYYFFGNDCSPVSVPFVLESGDRETFKIAFPEPGKYRVKIFYSLKKINSDECIYGFLKARCTNELKFIVVE